MKKIIKNSVIVLFLVTPLTAFGQTRKITGTVVAFEQFPLKHVVVKARKAKTETTTDENGKFEIEVVSNKDMLMIKDPVFLDYSKKIGENDNDLHINLIIKNDEQSMNEAVSSGYIASTDMDYGRNHLWKYNNVFYQFNDAYEAIKYALPEARIVIENGRKGVQFRGAKSITQSSAALIVVDGVVVDDVGFLTGASIKRITKKA